MLEEILNQIHPVIFFLFFPFFKTCVKLRIFFTDLRKEKGLRIFPVRAVARIVSIHFFQVFTDLYVLFRLQKDIKVVVYTSGSIRLGFAVQMRQFTMISHQVVDAACKLDHIIDPATLFRSQFGNHPFV